MTNRFLLGAVAGITTVVVAVPIIAQISSAASSASSSTDTVMFHKFTERTFDTSQEGIQSMIDRDDAFLEHADEMLAIHKSATQAHKTALAAALSIADDTARAEAVRAAQEAFRTSIMEAIEANPELKEAMPGPMMLLHGPGRGHKMKLMGGGLLEKLGMTREELRAAVEGGKTLEQIAEEKGVELPENVFFKMRAMPGQSSTSVQ